MEKKKVNFTEEERAILLELVDKHKSIIENKKTDAVSAGRKRVAWVLIEEEFNSRRGMSKRSQKQLKKCWDNLKEKWRKEKAADSREVFATGGGSPHCSQMTDELQRVGAVASHMNVRVDNIYDSDRGRHGTDPCSSSSSYTPAVLALLQETQVDNEADWQDHQLSPDERGMAQDEPCPETAATADNLDMPATPMSRLLPSATSAAPAQQPAVTPQARKRNSAAFGERELEARLLGLTEDNKRKKKEHVLRMQLLRAQLTHQSDLKKLTELDIKIKEAKLGLIKTKTALLKGDELE